MWLNGFALGVALSVIVHYGLAYYGPVFRR